MSERVCHQTIQKPSALIEVVRLMAFLRSLSTLLLIVFIGFGCSKPKIDAVPILSIPRNASANERRAAAQATFSVSHQLELGECGHELRKLTEDPDEVVAAWVASAILRSGSKSDDIAKRIVEFSKARNVEVRLVSLIGLSIISKRGNEANDRLLQLLSDSAPEIRGEALRVLAGSAEWDTIPIIGLISLVSDKNDANIQITSLEVLARIGPRAAEALPVVLALLKDEYSPIRHRAIDAAIQIAPERPEVIGTLLELTEHSSNQTQTNALRALCSSEITVPDADRKLLQLEQSADVEVSRLANKCRRILLKKPMK